MAYNKKLHLQTNIEAIRTAFILDRKNRKPTEAERGLLMQYSGFGGLKCILNPAQTEADKAYWTKSELDLFPMISDLHKLIREYSADEQEYKAFCISAIQIFQFADKEKAIPAKVIVSEIFNAVISASTVKIDIAGRTFILIKRIQKITSDTPLTRNIIFENVQTVTCPF